MIKVVKNYRSKSDKGTEHKVPKRFRAQELRTRLCRALGSKVEQSGLYASIASLQAYLAATRIFVQAQVWKGIRGFVLPGKNFGLQDWKDPSFGSLSTVRKQGNYLCVRSQLGRITEHVIQGNLEKYENRTRKILSTRNIRNWPLVKFSEAEATVILINNNNKNNKINNNNNNKPYLSVDCHVSFCRVCARDHTVSAVEPTNDSSLNRQWSINLDFLKVNVKFIKVCRNVPGLGLRPRADNSTVLDGPSSQGVKRSGQTN